MSDGRLSKFTGNQKIFSHQRARYEPLEAEKLSQMLSERYAPILIEPFKKEKLVAMQTSAGTFPNLKTYSSEFIHGMNIIPQTQYEGIFFIFPLHGFVESDEARGLISAAKGAALSSDGSTCNRLGFSPGHMQLGITIDKSFLIERLVALVERSITSDILFQPVLDASTGRYDALLSLFTCLNSWEFGEALASSPYTAERVTSTVTDFVLENWRHNYSHYLDAAPPLIAPKHVKLALDFIREPTGMLISVDELARLCGVSLRALQYGFKNFIGMSISDYQRKIRLEKARADIIKTTDNIDIIAHRWGFSNASRFSKHYRIAYGVFPSTMRNK